MSEVSTNWCDRCKGHGIISVPNPDGSQTAVLRGCPNCTRDIDRDHPDHCDWCGAPYDSVGSCTGSCDPSDEY